MILTQSNHSRQRSGIALIIVGTVMLFGEQLYALYFSDLAGALDGPQ